MKKIQVKSILQDKNSTDCLLAALSTALSYYSGEQVSIEQLKHYPIIKKTRNLNISFISLQQIGVIALDLGYKATLQLANPLLFTMNDIGKSITIKHLNRIQKGIKDNPGRHIALEILKKYLKKGGIIDVKMPDIKSIEETIQKNIPAITVSTTRFFYDQTPTFDFHATVVIGCTERDFIIHDPLEGERLIPKDVYLFGMMASSFADFDNGGILKIYK